MLFEVILALLMSYVNPLEVALGSRASASPHFAVPSFVFYTIIFFYDEVRRIYIRNGMTRTELKMVYHGWIARNTKW